MTTNLLDLFPELLVHVARSCPPSERRALRATCTALYDIDRRYTIPQALSEAKGELTHHVKDAWVRLSDSHPRIWDLFARDDRYRLTYEENRSTRCPWARCILNARVIRGRQTLYFIVTTEWSQNDDCWNMHVSEGGCYENQNAVVATDLGTALSKLLNHCPLLRAYLAEEHVQAHPTAPGTFRVVRPNPAEQSPSCCRSADAAAQRPLP